MKTFKDEETGERYEVVAIPKAPSNEFVIRPIKPEPKKRAMLGYATTRELLNELTARIEVDGNLDYSTVYGYPDQPNGTAIEDGE